MNKIVAGSDGMGPMKKILKIVAGKYYEPP